MKTIFLFLLLPSLSFAGRPVFQQVSLSELTAKSTTVFIGWPSPSAPTTQCPNKQYVWQVHRVLKGDKSLERTLIPIANHGYQMMMKKPIPSFAADKYKDGFSFEARSTILFTKKNADGCYELTAAGAQEEESKSRLVESFESKDCDVQLKAFDYLTENLPKACKADKDCQLFYVHPNSCETPLVLNKIAKKNFGAEWTAHMGRIREACSSRWEKQPACSPEVFPVRCQKNICEAGIPKSQKPVFTEARMKEQCAPHDGPAVSIQMRTGKGNYPVFSMNWWSNDRVIRRPDEYVLSNKEYTASYCAFERNCDGVQDLLLKVKMETFDEGTIDFSFRTLKGEEFKGTVPAKFTKTSQMLCG